MSDGGRGRDGEAAEPVEGGSGTGPVELAVGAVGGALTLLLFGFLGYEAFLARDAGPLLTTEVVAVGPAGEGTAVRVRVRNEGGETAERVQLAGQVVRDGSPVEEATATLAYVPAESRREAVLVFTVDPAGGELLVRVEGYEVP